MLTYSGSCGSGYGSLSYKDCVVQSSEPVCQTESCSQTHQVTYSCIHGFSLFKATAVGLARSAYQKEWVCL